MTPRIGGNQHNADRHPNDLYPTHPNWTCALLNLVKFRGKIWEPAAGNGDMVAVLKKYKYEVRATDISMGQDFLKIDSPWEGSIITNPPYRIADEFVHQALRLSSEQVAMLLPIGALGGKNRHDSLWSRKPPSVVIVVCSRMPVGEKNSQFNHIWAVWDSKISSCMTKLLWAP